MLFLFIVVPLSVSHVGEFELMRLHFILNLRRLQMKAQQSPPLDLYISFVSQKSFGQAIADVHQAAGASTTIQGDPAYQPLLDQVNSVQQQPWSLLHFRSAKSSFKSECSSRIYFRDCGSLAEAIAQAPIRSILFCDMMVTDCAQWTTNERAAALSRLLIIISHMQRQSSIATIIPPASWDQLVERKDEVYAWALSFAKTIHHQRCAKLKDLV